MFAVLFISVSVLFAQSGQQNGIKKNDGKGIKKEQKEVKKEKSNTPKSKVVAKKKDKGQTMGKEKAGQEKQTGKKPESGKNKSDSIKVNKVKKPDTRELDKELPGLKNDGDDERNPVHQGKKVQKSSMNKNAESQNE